MGTGTNTDTRAQAEAQAQAQVQTPTPAPTRAQIQTPPLTSLLPKYAVLAFFLAMLLVSWRVPRAWMWQKCLSYLHLQATWHKNGIQFSYFRDWRVVEHQNENEFENEHQTTAPPSGGDESGNPGNAGLANTQLPDSVIDIEGPHGAVITFALFGPSYPLTLNAYADHMRIRFAAALNDNTAMPHTGPLMPVVGRIHGVNYNGFRCHFTAPSSMTSWTSRCQYFYELRTPTNKIMLTLQLPERYIDSPEVQLILDTLKLDQGRGEMD